MQKRIIYLFVILFSFISLQAQGQLADALKKMPQVIAFKEMKHDTMYSESYEVIFKQLLDHNNPSGPTFPQRLIVSNVNFKNPTLLVTEGYGIWSGAPYELSRMLNSNQIVVEHRYFNNSRPDSASFDWKYLTVAQAAADHHAVVEAFKKLYTGKWVNTGISKGGQTTIYHSYFYPNDVDASVPYVAPLNLAQEDPRIYHWLNTVGSDETREKIKEFQLEVFKRYDEMMAFINNEIATDSLDMYVDAETAFEFQVLEYPFSFWQWGHKQEDIPAPNSSSPELYKHLKKVVGLSMYTKKDVQGLHSFFVQAYNEEGYYSYDITDFKQYMKKLTKSASNILFVPKDASVNYDCKLNQGVYNWVQQKANNFIFIYGGYDTWTSTSVELLGLTNSVKMVKKGGSHGTRIKNFSDDEKKIIYDKLEEFLGVKVKRM
jgi:hypothetical protein